MFQHKVQYIRFYTRSTVVVFYAYMLSYCFAVLIYV